MKKWGIDYIQLDAARYAAELRKHLRTSEPGKLVDSLIMRAIMKRVPVSFLRINTDQWGQSRMPLS